MSWAYHLAGDAEVALRRLEVEAQEAIYDALEELAEEADGLPHGRSFSHLIYAAVGGDMLTFTLTLHASPVSQVVTLLGIDEP